MQANDRAKKIILTLWKWSWLATLPCTIIFIIWINLTLSQFIQFRVKYDAFIFSSGLYKIGNMELSHKIGLIKQYLKYNKGKHTKTIRTVNLFIDQKEKNKLNRDLPYSGRAYQKGKLLYPDGTINNIKLRYRGDNYYHWAYFKKSYRIKTKKKELFEGLRSFNLNVPKRPEQVNNFFTYKLAESLELITPRSEMINLKINGIKKGLYLFVEQINELTLRTNKRMPGDIYRGEWIYFDLYKDANIYIFDKPYLWDKVASNNHYPEEHRKPLLRLITSLNNDEISHANLMSQIDMSVWARFNLLETLSQSNQANNVHNWRLYYDPSINKFEPIVWDLVGWQSKKTKVKPDIFPSDFHWILSHNYQFLLERHKAIEDFFQKGSAYNFIDLLDQSIEPIKTALAYDSNVATQWEYNSPSVCIKALDNFQLTVKKTFTHIKEYYLESPGEIKYSTSKNNVLNLHINGRKPIYEIHLNYDRPVNGTIHATVRYIISGKIKNIDVSGAVIQHKNKIILNVPLMSRHEITEIGGLSSLPTKSLSIKPAYYELILMGIPADINLLNMQVRRNRDSEMPLDTIKKVENIKKYEFKKDSYAIVLPQPSKQILLWEGEVKISGITEVFENTYIKPGTTILLKEGASLIFHNKITAEGTAKQPIIFKSAENNIKPWGAVIIKGRNANGSRFKWSIFQEGSGYKTELSEYSAMLSIHNCKDIVIQNSIFKNNKIVDDMLHAVYSDIKLLDCVFEDSLFDAVDLDICNATIKNSKFYNSGNDALDLMSSNVAIANCLMKNSADKGISVGEGTILQAVNISFIENKIGIQTKDNSFANICNIDLVANEIALDAYKKNWRYDVGGKILLSRGCFLNNALNFKSDKYSQIFIYDSYVKYGNELKKKKIRKRIILDKTVDSINKRESKTLKINNSLDYEFSKDLTEEIKLKRRGSYGLGI